MRFLSVVTSLYCDLSLSRVSCVYTRYIIYLILVYYKHQPDVKVSRMSEIYIHIIIYNILLRETVRFIKFLNANKFIKEILKKIINVVFHTHAWFYFWNWQLHVCIYEWTFLKKWKKKKNNHYLQIILFFAIRGR